MEKLFQISSKNKNVISIGLGTFFLDTTIGKADIVLNPIFNSNFNNFRSPTKFFDTTRLEAVGIYSNLKPFRELY